MENIEITSITNEDGNFLDLETRKISSDRESDEKQYEGPEKSLLSVNSNEKFIEPIPESQKLEYFSKHSDQDSNIINLSLDQLSMPAKITSKKSHEEATTNTKENKLGLFDSPKEQLRKSLEEHSEEDKIPIETHDIESEVKSLKQELSDLQNSYNSLHKTCQKYEDINQKLKKTIKEHKTDSTAVLQARISSLLDEKIKLGSDLEKSSKINRELSSKVEGYKKMIESNEEINKKRDSQFESMLSKLNLFKNENSSLKQELQKKNLVMNSMHNELTELRQIRELRNANEKQHKVLDELKKIIENKDIEINILKSLVKSLQGASPGDSLKTLGKLPPLKGSKSSYMHKSIFSKGVVSAVSVNRKDILSLEKSVIDEDNEEDPIKGNKKREEEVLDKIEMLKSLVKEKEMRNEEYERGLMQAENKLSLQYEYFVKEIKIRKIDKDNQEREVILMSIEDSISSQEENRLRELKRLDDEEAAKKLENERKLEEAKLKPKGKLPAKATSKSGAKVGKKK